MSIENPTLAHFRHFSSLFTHFPSTPVENVRQITPFYAKQSQFYAFFARKRRFHEKTNPIQTQLKPIQSQFKPNKAKNKPNQTQLLQRPKMLEFTQSLSPRAAYLNRNSGMLAHFLWPLPRVYPRVLLT
jgi:hypothetical protein